MLRLGSTYRMGGCRTCGTFLRGIFQFMGTGLDEPARWVLIVGEGRAHSLETARYTPCARLLIDCFCLGYSLSFIVFLFHLLFPGGLLWGQNYCLYNYTIPSAVVLSSFGGCFPFPLFTHHASYWHRLRSIWKYPRWKTVWHRLCRHFVCLHRSSPRSLDHQPTVVASGERPGP